MKLILFDCDGTLVDSANIIHLCMSAAFQKHGFDAPMPQDTRSIIGLSLHHAMDQLLTVQNYPKLDQMVQDYKDHFFHIRTQDNLLEPLYDGIKELIVELSSHDEFILGIVTGKSKRGVESILNGHQLRSHFLPIRTADDCPSKPHPAMVLECCDEVGIEPQASYVIGDATFDMDMARSAGATPIGVDWGYHTVDQLKASGANHILNKPLELFEIIL